MISAELEPHLLLLDRSPKTNRHCGDCTLCCRLLPVERNLNKPAGVRCRHQSRKGCGVYRDLAVVSPSCDLWSCRWLIDPETNSLRRPDRSHYVIDVMPDFIGASPPEGGEAVNVMVMQVWIDPAYPDAYRDPALRRYIEHIAETKRMATIIRWGSAGRCIAVFAPCLSNDGEWFEKEGVLQSEHSTWRNPMQAVHDHVELMRKGQL